MRQPVAAADRPAGAESRKRTQRTNQRRGGDLQNPIYAKWFAEYSRLQPDVRFNYQPIGSGGGIRQLTNRTVFFGASDMPMTEDQLQMAPGPILHIPSVLGAVVPICNLPGAVQSRAGDMVKASAESVTKAAAEAVIPDDFRVSITNAPGTGAYPLSSFTWLLLYTDPPDKTQARALNEFVKWALTDGQQYAAELHFARLPQSLVARELMALETIKTN